MLFSTQGIMNTMKKSLFLGVIILAYGMSLQALASDTIDGKLTIIGHIVEPCHIDMTGGSLKMIASQMRLIDGC
jgi:hypothetical protein